MSEEITEPMVCIIFLSGDDYDRAIKQCEDSTQTLVEYLTAWDYGHETDGDASVNGMVALEDLRPRPRCTTTTHGTQYWLVEDPALGYCGLYRRPHAEEGG